MTESFVHLLFKYLETLSCCLFGIHPTRATFSLECGNDLLICEVN